MYTIPVSHVALYSRKIAVVHYSHPPCRTLVCFALIWRMLVLMYAILVWMMYINPMYTLLSPPINMRVYPRVRVLAREIRRAFFLGDVGR